MKIFAIILPVLFFVILDYLSYVPSQQFKDYTQFDRIDIVVIGSSHSMGLFDNNQDLNVLNLSLPAQRLIGGIELINQVSNKLDRGSIIIINLSVFSYCGDLEFRFGGRDVYLDFIKEDIYGLRLSDRLFARLSYVGINNINNLDLFASDSSESGEFVNTGIERESFLRSLAYECDHPVQSESLKSLQQFITNTRNKGVELYFVYTPMHYSYWDSVLSEGILIDQIRNTTCQIAIKNNLRVIDYSSDYRFYYMDEYFSDSDHLNEIGTTYFSNILLSDIYNLENSDCD